MFKKLFRRSTNITSMEKKGVSPYAALFMPSSNNVFGFATTNVKWMEYYSTVAPVGDAVNKVADKASRIELMLFAPDKNEALLPVTEHPFLKLLKRPNKYQTQQQFQKEMIAHERICGNNYLQVVGGISASKDRFISEPVASFNLRPDFITSIVPDPVDGRALYYQYTMPNGGITIFRRHEMKSVDGRIIDAYIDEKGSSQLYVFKNISSRRWTGYYTLWGDSPLQAAEVQIAQYFEAAVYNYFLIANGLSARKLISPDPKIGEILTQAQKDQIKDFIEKNFSGAVNSGKTIVSPIPFQIDDLQVSLKDMDFKSLSETTMQAVYRALNVPLPLIGSEHTSMNNMEVSTLMFYDDGVLPPLSNMCGNLFSFLFMDRYKDASKFLYLGYNESSIGALQPRMAQNLKLQKEAGVSTINELREYQGLGRIDSEGCDQIYIGSNVMPIGKDTNLQDTIGIDKPIQEDDVKKAWLEVKDANGRSLFSEDFKKLFS